MPTLAAMLISHGHAVSIENLGSIIFYFHSIGQDRQAVRLPSGYGLVRRHSFLDTVGISGMSTIAVIVLTT